MATRSERFENEPKLKEAVAKEKIELAKRAEKANAMVQKLRQADGISRQSLVAARANPVH